MEPVREDAPRLLKRDEEELDRAAIIIRDGRPAFLIFVCPGHLQGAALGHLRVKVEQRGIPEPLRLSDGEHVLWVLSDAAGSPSPSVRSIAVSGDTRAVFRALNWHREKLRRGIPVLLWLSDLDELRELREIAPDAYSFRDSMVVLRGDLGLPPIAPTGESIELLLARSRWESAEAPEDKGNAAFSYVYSLVGAGRINDAELVLDHALSAVPGRNSADDQIRILRARMCAQRAEIGLAREAYVEAFRAAIDGAAELRTGAWEQALDEKLMLRLMLIGPESIGASRIEHAIIDAELTGADPHVIDRQLDMVRIYRVRQGRIKDATQIGSKIASIPGRLERWQAIDVLRRASTLSAAGHLIAAEEEERRGIEKLVKMWSGAALIGFNLAFLLRLRGELECARRLLEHVSALAGNERTLEARIPHLNGLLLLDAGDIRGALADLRRAFHRSAELMSDGGHYDACDTYVWAIRQMKGAARLDEDVFAAAVDELDAAENVSLAMAGSSGLPWYAVLFPGLRSQLLAMSDDRLPEAIHLAGVAAERARVDCVEVAPKYARVHLENLIRARRFESAIAALPAAEAEASEQGNLRELSTIQALAVVAMLRWPAGSSPKAAEEKHAALRETMDATGAPRIVAEALLELACNLPAESTSPDPVALLDEAHALFIEMPMPGNEARCLEAMGDVLLARGRPDEAKRRYLTARRRLEHYGLGLRLPLLNKKLSALTDPKETS